MAREPDDSEVRKLIAECVGIVREDRDRAHYKTLHEKFGEGTKEPGEGDPPPAKPQSAEPEPEFGLWGRKKPR